MKGIYMLLPLLLPIFPLLNGGAFAQTEVGPGRTRNDMVQTRLLLKPDFVNKYLSGVAILTLQPRGYTADSLELDAKGMTIDKVAIVKGNSASDLSYSYDGMVLHIRLDRKYKVGEKYRVSITYTSKPDEFGKRENGKNGMGHFKRRSRYLTIGSLLRKYPSL